MPSNVANTAGSLDQAVFDPAQVPQAMSFDPNASTQLTYPVNVGITNTSDQTWNAATTTLRYRWYLAGSSTSLADSGDVAAVALTPGQKQTVQVNVSPPSLPAGMDAARFTLRFDVLDSAGSSPAFFADRGNQPLDNPVIVNKVLSANIGLEHFWQFKSQPVGAGITQMTNIANGNSVLSLTPLSRNPPTDGPAAMTRRVATAIGRTGGRYAPTECRRDARSGVNEGATGRRGGVEDEADFAGTRVVVREPSGRTEQSALIRSSAAPASAA